MVEPNQREEKIQYISFNQNQDHFVCATNHGFKVYSTFPVTEVLSRDMEGGIGIAELLYQTNLLLLVGGGPTPKFPSHKAILWDDYQRQIVGEIILKFPIKRVKVRKEKIAILTEHKVYLYNLSDLSLSTSFETCYNPKGLFCFSVSEKMLCCPDQQDIGSIHIVNLENNHHSTVKAHNAPLSCMETDYEGDLIATTSTKGTIIRLFAAENGTLLHELRRGTDNQDILSITFSLDSLWIACTSDSGTAHVFSLEGLLKMDAPDERKDATKNQKSKLAFLKVVHAYFDSEWSYAHIKLVNKKSLLTFLKGDTKHLLVVSNDGIYYKICYDEKYGKSGQQEEMNTFFKSNH